MTREEVISRLNKFAENAWGFWHDGDADVEAIDLAIEVLKAEPVCEHFYKGYCCRFEDGCFCQCRKE